MFDRLIGGVPVIVPVTVKIDRAVDGNVDRERRDVAAARSPDSWRCVARPVRVDRARSEMVSLTFAPVTAEGPGILHRDRVGHRRPREAAGLGDRQVGGRWRVSWSGGASSTSWWSAAAAALPTLSLIVVPGAHRLGRRNALRDHVAVVGRSDRDGHVLHVGDQPDVASTDCAPRPRSALRPEAP